MAYKAQRDSARRRDIDFEFTPLGWVIWWDLNLPPGAKRGRKRDQYVMARRGDRGPYADWNVYIATPKQNANDIPKDMRDRMRYNARGHKAPHLKDRQNHPRAQMVITPEGTWNSAALAAEHYGITRQAAAYRARYAVQGWGYR